MDYMGHWKLRERPFEATWDPRFFYGSPHHLEALNRMVYFATERTMNACLLTGDIGCGKTLTRAVFSQQLDPGDYFVIALENSGFSFSEILETIIRRLDPSTKDLPASNMARCELFSRLLTNVHVNGRHTVLVLDEAQDMDAQTIHDLRWMTNYNSSGRTLLSMVLIGQPEIVHRVATNAAMSQRISLRFHIPPLTCEDVSGYIAHRLRVAGHPTGNAFTRDACDMIHHLSGGVPREINRLAKLALEHAWVRGQQIVLSRAVDAVATDMRQQQSLLAA